MFAADLDGDGDADVLFAADSGPEGKVGWYENLDGMGTFGKQQILARDELAPRNAVATDIDGDGDLDVVYSNQDTAVFWMENLGKGQFADARRVGQAGAPPGGITSFTTAVADLDGDGDPDIAVPVRFEGTVVWFKNVNGRGLFSEPIVVATSRPGVNSVVAADMDSDGDLDLLSTSVNDGTVAWHENMDGKGLFDTEHIVNQGELGATVWSTAADFDTDGDQDVLTIGSLGAAWFENLDEGQVFITRRLDRRLAFAQPITGDVDGDGDLDVLAGNWIENVNGAGPTGPARPTTTNAGGLESIHAADVDGDGDLDVLSASRYGGRLTWARNDGSGGFGAPLVVPHDASGASVVLTADIDGDGDLDVLSASTLDNKIAWYENVDAAGSLGPQRIVAADRNDLWDIDAADLDGDGDIDVVATSRIDDVVAWYENVGGMGHFGPANVISERPDGARTFDDQHVKAVDIDLDGDNDIVWSSAYDGTLAWHENDGGGTFGAAKLLARGEDQVRLMQITDFDGDGRVDLLTASNFGVKLFPRGSVLLKRPVLSLFAGDLDGDSDADLLFSGPGESFETVVRLAWVENLQGGGFSDPRLFTFPPPTVDREAASILALDIDKDGDLDVLRGGIRFFPPDSPIRDFGTVSAFTNTDGLGTFGPQEIISSIPGSLNSLHAADIDGDGDLDLFSANYRGSRVDWARNDLAPRVNGDTNGDETVTAEDIDRFYAALRRSSNDPKFDLTGEGVLDENDVDRLVKGLLASAYGDANLDGRFDSADFVQVFQRGQYEDGVPGNSTWASGDWNGDREFDTGDLVFAFQHGGYVAQGDAKSEFATPLLASDVAPPSRKFPSVSRRQHLGLNIPWASDVDGETAPSRPRPVMAQLGPGLAHRPIRRNSAHAVEAAPRIGSGQVPAGDRDPSATLAGDDQLFRQRLELISSPVPEARKAEGEKVLSILRGDHWE